MLKRYWIWGVLVLLLTGLGVVVCQRVQHNRLEQTRIRLLEDALAPATAEGAAYSWAEAVKERNGAWQYAVMDEQLRARYRREFESSNWVTGFSSPWVEKYQVERQSQDEQGNITYRVTFDWYTSGGFAYSSKATLVVSLFNKGQSNEHWLLSFLDFNYEPGI